MIGRGAGGAGRWRSRRARRWRRAGARAGRRGRRGLRPKVMARIGIEQHAGLLASSSSSGPHEHGHVDARQGCERNDVSPSVSASRRRARGGAERVRARPRTRRRVPAAPLLPRERRRVKSPLGSSRTRSTCPPAVCRSAAEEVVQQEGCRRRHARARPGPPAPAAGRVTTCAAEQRCAPRRPPTRRRRARQGCCVRGGSTPSRAFASVSANWCSELSTHSTSPPSRPDGVGDTIPVRTAGSQHDGVGNGRRDGVPPVSWNRPHRRPTEGRRMASTARRPGRSWKWIVLWAIVAFGVFGLIQPVPYGRQPLQPAASNPFQWTDPQAEALAKKSCYDCHSNETNWWWATSIAPFSWLVQRTWTAGARASTSPTGPASPPRRSSKGSSTRARCRRSSTRSSTPAPS